MWFAERGLGILGSITTKGKFPRSVKLTGQARFPQNVVTGPDGNLWATAGSTNTYWQESNGVPDPYGAVWAVTPAGVTVNVTKLPKNSDPRAIVPAPNGKGLWFTMIGFVGKITTQFKLQLFKLPQDNRTTQITVGPDSNLWFCETVNAAIGRVSIRGAKPPTITMFPFPKNGGPASVVAGPDGYLWADEFQTAKVAELTTKGTIVYEIPLAKGSFPKGMAVGADGNLYVAEFGNGKIAEISIAKRVLIREFEPPTPNSGPWGMVAGPDGNIWFAESSVGKIGKLTIPADD